MEKNAFLRVKANFISRQWKRTQLSNPVATWAFGWKEEIDQRLTSRAEKENVKRSLKKLSTHWLSCKKTFWLFFSLCYSGGSWCCLYFCCIAHWFWPSPALHRHEPPNLIWFCTFRSYRRSHLFRTSPAFYLLRSSPPTHPPSSTEGLFSDHHHHGARPRPDTGQWAPLSQSTYDRL